jgi:predicted metal-dependent hydrolase
VDREKYRRGIELFNRGEFFAAHEVLEDVWRAAPQTEKRFLQGLIQIAVGLHHHSTGNLTGARSLLARGAKNLRRYPERYAGMDVAALLQAVARWEQALARGEVLPEPPHVEL